MYIYKKPWFHRMGNIILEGETTTLMLHSCQVDGEEQEPQLVLVDGEIDPSEQAIADWLIAPGGIIEGGAQVADVDHSRAVEKIKAHEQVRKLRDFHEVQGVSTAAGQFDTDPDSQRRLFCASISALCAINEENASWSIQWRVANNSVIPLTAQEMLDAAKTVATHFDLIQNNKTSLDVSIEAATTAGEVQSIDLTSGWPV